MAKLPQIIPVTDFRQDAATALKRVKVSPQRICVATHIRSSVAGRDM